MCLKESDGSTKMNQRAVISRGKSLFSIPPSSSTSETVCLDFASPRKVRSPRHKLAKLSPWCLEDSVEDRLHAQHILDAYMCVCVLFLPDASVPVGERSSPRRGNGSFVFLLILPVDTRVADLLGDLCRAAGEGLL